MKKRIFSLIAVMSCAAVAATCLSACDTLYKNSNSATLGETEWEAAFAAENFENCTAAATVAIEVSGTRTYTQDSDNPDDEENEPETITEPFTERTESGSIIRVDNASDAWRMDMYTSLDNGTERSAVAGARVGDANYLYTLGSDGIDWTVESVFDYEYPDVRLAELFGGFAGAYPQFTYKNGIYRASDFKWEMLEQNFGEEMTFDAQVYFNGDKQCERLSFETCIDVSAEEFPSSSYVIDEVYISCEVALSDYGTTNVSLPARPAGLINVKDVVGEYVSSYIEYEQDGEPVRVDVEDAGQEKVRIIINSDYSVYIDSKTAVVFGQLKWTIEGDTIYVDMQYDSTELTLNYEGDYLTLSMGQGQTLYFEKVS